MEVVRVVGIWKMSKEVTLIDLCIISFLNLSCKLVTDELHNHRSKIFIVILKLRDWISLI